MERTPAHRAHRPQRSAPTSTGAAAAFAVAAVVLTQTLLLPSTDQARAAATGNIRAGVGTTSGGAGVTGGAAVEPRRPGPLRLALIGDSYFNGKGAKNGRGMGVVLAERLDADLVNLAEGGTGWADDGPEAPATASYEAHGAAALAAEPDLVVVGGGFNDHAAISKQLETYAEVARNARSLLGQLSAAPGVRTVVIGPFSVDGEPPASLLRLRDVLEAEADRAGVGWVDPIAEGWIRSDAGDAAGNASRMIRSDRIHPSRKGHRYLGRKMAQSVRAMVPST